MADQLLGIITCNTTDSNYTAGDVIEVFYDDVSEDVEVELNGSPAVSGGIILLSNFDSGNYSISGVIGNTTIGFTSQYSFCDGNDHVLHDYNEAFPYFTERIIIGAAVCSGVSCDLFFTGTPIPTDATDATTADGEIYVIANSSQSGPIRFAFQPLDYDQITGGDGTANGSSYEFTFTGLLPGMYTIYAVDSANCKGNRSVTVGAGDNFGNYGQLYYYDFKDYDNKTYRVEILKRDYTGSSTELASSGPTPCTFTLRGENRGVLQEKLSGEIILELQNQTDGQFIELSQHERQYFVRVYLDPAGTNELLNQGYITPELYTEPYEAGPYATRVKATDRLSDLKEFDFLDESGQRIRGNIPVVDILMICLNKLEMKQNIRICFNLYEDSHNSTASDDPLKQTYLDCESFYDQDGKPQNCNKVVKGILKSLGCRLVSWGNKWWVIRIEEQKESSIAYREFDLQFAYVTNSTISPIIDITTSNEGTPGTGARFLAGNNSRSIEPVYSKVNVISDRYIKDNLFPKFIETNLENNGTEFGGWSVSFGSNPIIAQPAQRVGGEYFYNLVVLPQLTGPWDSYILTSNFVEYKTTDAFTIKPEYEIISTKPVLGTTSTNRVDPPYYKLKWLFKVGSDYLSSDGSWSTTETINEYFSKPGDKEFTIFSNFDDAVTSNTTALYEFRLYAPDIYETDVTESDLTTMENSVAAISTTGLVGGNRIIAKRNTGATSFLSYYEFTFDTPTEDRPRIITPDDNSSARWIRTDTRDYPTDFLERVSTRIELENIEFEFLPNGLRFEEEDVTSRTMDTGNLRELDYEVFHFDLDTVTNNTERIVLNYFKLQGGTATDAWGDDDLKIQDILANTISGLLFPDGDNGTKRGAFRMNASFLMDVTLRFYNVLRNLQDNDRIHTFTSLSWDLKHKRLRNSEMIELGSGTSITLKAHKDNAFTSGFN